MPASSYIPPEETLQKTYDIHLFRRIYSFARPYFWLLALALLFASLLSAGEIVLPYLTKTGIDKYIVIKGKLIDLSLLSADLKSEIKSNRLTYTERNRF